VIERYSGMGIGDREILSSFDSGAIILPMTRVEKHCEEPSSGSSRYGGENEANPVILAMVRA
jgi:hypothetical protein